MSESTGCSLLGSTVIFAVPPFLPISGWADEKLAELAEQVDKMAERHKSKAT